MASKKQLSIQAEARKHGKSIGAYLNEKSRKGAFNAGLPWSSDDVAILVQMIESDETTFEMATRTGRTYYGALAARAHVGFALRHETAIWGRSR
jgi:hypothetical protein